MGFRKLCGWVCEGEGGREVPLSAFAAVIPHGLGLGLGLGERSAACPDGRGSREAIVIRELPRAIGPRH